MSIIEFIAPCVLEVSSIFAKWVMAADGYSGYRAGRLVGAVERRMDTLWRLGSAKSRWSGRWRIRHGLSLVASASLIALTSVWVLPGASGATSPESASNHSGTSMFDRDADAIGDAPVSDPAIVTRNVLARVTPPRRDEVALSRRYRGACTDPLPAPVALSRTVEAGEHRRFWVLDEGRRTFFQADTTLAGQSDHLLLYVQDGVPVAPGAIDETIRQFEEKSLPVLERVFGALPPGTRISVFNGRVPGVGGYFSSSDLVPVQSNPYSNERVMVYMNTDITKPGQRRYDGVLAHEVQHLIHWARHPQQDSWINEGASELAMALLGFGQTSPARAYLLRPGLQLNAWASKPSEAIPHYGASLLFYQYLSRRIGGYDRIADLIASPGVSTQTVDHFLATLGATSLNGIGTLRDFDDLYRDFVVSNLLDDRSVSDGRYGYDPGISPGKVTADDQFELSKSRPGALGFAVDGTLPPYGARYIEVTGAGPGDLSVRFDAPDRVELIKNSDFASGFWWSVSADEVDATLMRDIDLTRVTTASLEFEAWYDLEADYDYAGVAVSDDEGCTWKTVEATSTTMANPVGQNPGIAFTGTSGPGTDPSWVRQRVDLDRYTGKKVRLQFFMMTDQAYHGAGLALRGIKVDAVGFDDETAHARGGAADGWMASGFIRTQNAVKADWSVQAVVFGSGGINVVPMRVSDAGSMAATGTLRVAGFGRDTSRVVLVVSPMAPVTQQRVGFRLTGDLESDGS